MTDMEAIAARLAGLDETYENAAGGQPEDGDYQAVIERFDFFEGKQTPDLYLKVIMRIAHDAEYDGADLEAIFNLTAEDKLRWTKKFLGILGYEGTLSQLPTQLEQFVGVPVDVTVKNTERINDFTGLPYLNVYVNRRLGSSVGDVESPVEEFKHVPAQADDSSIPF